MVRLEGEGLRWLEHAQVRASKRFASLGRSTEVVVIVVVVVIATGSTTRPVRSAAATTVAVNLSGGAGITSQPSADLSREADTELEIVREDRALGRSTAGASGRGTGGSERIGPCGGPDHSCLVPERLGREALRAPLDTMPPRQGVLDHEKLTPGITRRKPAGAVPPDLRRSAKPYSSS